MSVNEFMAIIFWISLVILFYTYFGYPLLLWIVSKAFSNPVKKRYITPKVSFIVVVHNEEKHIAKKIENILALDYPKENLEIIIGSDGSSDRTNEILEGYRPSGVGCRVFISGARKGKVNLLNEIVPQTKGEIIVFSDARQKFDKSALKELIANFSDSQVGCVSGELIFKDENANGVGKGVGFYWKYEKWMRKMESNLHSMLGATGAIYAIRKALFMVPPADIILDHVFIPLKIIEHGYRAVFDSKAKAFDKISGTSREEFTRKVRTLAGNFQLFSSCGRLLNPFKSKVAWQFFSHKFLRVVAFLFLILMFISNLFLLAYFPYNFIIIAQGVFYSFAVIGWVLEKISIKSKLCAVPYVFCMLNFAALKGFLNFLFGKQKVTWEKAQ